MKFILVEVQAQLGSYSINMRLNYKCWWKFVRDEGIRSLTTLQMHAAGILLMIDRHESCAKKERIVND